MSSCNDQAGCDVRKIVVEETELCCNYTSNELCGLDDALSDDTSSLHDIDACSQFTLCGSSRHFL